MRSLRLSAVVVCALAIGCGGDSGGGTSPQKAAALFQNPDGILSGDSIANGAFNEAIRASQTFETSQGFNPFSGLASGLTQKGGGFDFSDCVSGDADKFTFKLSCLAEFTDGECSGSGKLSFDISGDPGSDNFSIEYEYKDANFTCVGSPSTTCNGTASISQVDMTTVSCSDLTCEFDGEVFPSSGCFTSDDTSGSNLVLVELDNGSVVCVRIAANSDCSKVCSEWRDAEGSAIIVCDVSETNDNICSPEGESIDEVDNCVLDRTQTECPATF